jgi:hypothetical protein
VNPTIAAAWISGGVGAIGIVSTAVTAWIGSRATRRATDRTIKAGADENRATLLATHDAWLREKRRAAYEEAVIWLLYRQRNRERGRRIFRLEQEAKQFLKDPIASYAPSGWYEAYARLVAYASDAVVAASNASYKADFEVWGLYEKWAVKVVEETKRAINAGSPRAAADNHTIVKARGEVDLALEATGAADIALINAIRAELRSMPQTIMSIL